MRPSTRLWAGLSLLLALIGIATALLVQHGAPNREGPQALSVLPDHGLALSVDDAIWLLAPDGSLRTRRTTTELALPGLPANLALAPDGRLGISVRGEAAVFWLDPLRGERVGRTALQWPVGQRDALKHPHTLAIGPHGQIAVATAGHHRVMLFAPDGHFLGITPPGTYAYTNGLWWTATSLWTTDTNRFALVELNPQTLAVRQRIALDTPSDAARYLSWATGHPAQLTGLIASEGDRVPSPRSGPPLATVFRMANGMRLGRPVDVWPDGHTRDYPLPRLIEGSDMAWIGGTLLVVDGHERRLRRFSQAREPLPDWGDAQVQRLLKSSLQHQHRMAQLYQGGLLTGVLGLLVGLLLWRRAQHVDSRGSHRVPPSTAGVSPAELAMLGTPALPPRELLRAACKHLGPWLYLVAWLLLTPLSRAWHATFLQTWPMPSRAMGMALTLLGALALLTWLLRRHRQAAQAPQHEALFNAAAVQLLQQTPAWATFREPGERLRETFTLASLGALRWVILTDRRLLVLRVGLRQQVLESSWSRHDIVKVSLPKAQRLGWLTRLLRWPVPGGWVRIRLRDGQVLEGALRSAVTAQRVAMLLDLPLRARGRSATPPTARR
ncbi:hypothetical protein [Aquabacterium sp.]|uniref:hypothetical protein n=1 Tax=Aquabacterium sp. TaxID=1872578 RepID=UPI0025BB08AC|nr:hypothetical protein [Aquabacterium sp.]